MMAVMERMKVEIYLFTKYVDNVNLAISTIPLDWRWQKVENGWVLGWDQNQEIRDRESGDSDARRTFFHARSSHN